MPDRFPLLRHPSFVAIWIGQFISILGDGIFNVAVILAILQRTGSAADVSVVAIASSVPRIVLILVGGAIADRSRRWLTLVVTDSARGSAVAVAAVLVAMGQGGVLFYAVLAAIIGIGQAFFIPALRASLPAVMPPRTRSQGNAALSVGSQAASLLGPVLGTVVIRVSGTSAAFFANALSFGVSAICIIMAARQGIWERQAAAGVHAGGGLGSEVRQGVQAVISRAWLRRLMGVGAMVNFVVLSTVIVGLPALTVDEYGRKSVIYGWFVAMYGAGGIAGALLGGKTGRTRIPLILQLIVTSGLCTILIGTSWFWPGTAGATLTIAAGTILVGLTLSMADVLLTTLLQQRIPKEILGRVMSVDYLVTIGVVPIGYAMAGVVSDIASAADMFLYGGVLVAVAAVAAGFAERSGQPRETPHAAAPQRN